MNMLYLDHSKEARTEYELREAVKMAQMAQISRQFLPHSYIDDTDFTLGLSQKYHF